jgi:hypothetical protein
MKTLSKIFGVGTLILGLSGCLKPSYGIYENHPFQFKEYLVENALTLYSDQESAQCGCDGSSYIEFDDKNKDGRFDVITLNNVKSGDALEKYASLEAGQKILNSIIDK